MRASENSPAAEQSKRFLYLYALAVSGGAVAYIPFLTILLPSQVTQWGRDDALTILAQAAFAGAIAASVSNIFFGWASDTSGNRLPWVATGLILSTSLLAAMPLATHATALITMIIAWQLSLNIMLAPLTAWAGDTVPDSQKGLLGGLLSFAPAFGALSGALVTLPSLGEQSDRHVLIAVLVLSMVIPVLIWGRPTPMPHLLNTCEEQDSLSLHRHMKRSAVIKMWLARLFVQIAEASLFAFLLLWFRSIEPGFGENDTANIFAVVLVVSVGATLVIGRWSDKVSRPILPLGICASIAAAGLLIMSAAGGLTLAITGYAIFGFTSSIFLALHSSQTLRVLPTAKTRGRNLGLFNLTNTVPSLIMPWLTLAMVPAYGFDALFILLAGLAIIAALLLASVYRR